METPLIIGANYRTTWQSNKAMRFKLAEIGNAGTVRLSTKKDPKGFWTEIKHLIWINSGCNNRKYFKQTGKVYGKM